MGGFLSLPTPGRFKKIFKKPIDKQPSLYYTITIKNKGDKENDKRIEVPQVWRNTPRQR